MDDFEARRQAAIEEWRSWLHSTPFWAEVEAAQAAEPPSEPGQSVAGLPVAPSSEFAEERDNRRYQAMVRVLRESSDLTAAQWRSLISSRNDAPFLVEEAVNAGVLAPDALPEVLAHAWCAAEFPEDTLGRPEWIDLFREAGFAVDGRPADPPRKRMRLYRGASPERSRGIAWTSDREKAQWFADRFSSEGENAVWTAVVEPEQILAMINVRDEHEYVLDTERLQIARLD